MQRGKWAIFRRESFAKLSLGLRKVSLLAALTPHPLLLLSGQRIRSVTS